MPLTIGTMQRGCVLPERSCSATEQNFVELQEIHYEGNYFYFVIFYF